MQFFFRNCTHILTRTLEKKFEEMFLVKIGRKGTSLSLSKTSKHCLDFQTLLFVSVSLVKDNDVMADFLPKQ